MVNILGVYHMTRAVLPTMVARQSGDIVNLGSVAAVKYSPGFAVYSATKYAVRSFSEALRNEVQPHNTRVTLIHYFFPAGRTRQKPIGLCSSA